MQCPPTPVPGFKMLTLGCLFARAIISHTLMPALSQIMDNSFAKAIWLSLEAFSTNFTISAVLALVGISWIEYDLQIPNALWFFVFFGTITGYNFVKYANIAGLGHRELKDSRRSIQIFSFICFAIVSYFSFRLSLDILLVLGGFAILTFFYAVPLLRYENLRSLTSLKVFVVALVWAGVTVIVPIMAAVIELDTDILLTCIQRFIIVIVLTIPFEIRDLEFDVASLKTLPQQLGIRRVKALGVSLLFICLILEGFKDEFSAAYALSLVLVTALIAIGLMRSEKRQYAYFASFWIEGIPIIWFGLLLFLSKLF